MAKIWHKRILAGAQVFTDCPLKYKFDVKAMFINDVESGVITAEEYEGIVGEPFIESEV